MIDSTGRPARRRHTVVWLVVLVVVLALGGGYAALALHHRLPRTVPSAAPVQTTTVVRTDLTDSQLFPGTVGYGPAQTVKGAGQGIVTRLPAPGVVTTRGAALYSVDGQPVPVFFGGTPLFRTLDKPGIEGPDVAMVAGNLVALGYATGVRTNDPQHAAVTPKLLGSLKKWQTAVGMTPTGTLAVGQVLLMPGPMRVSSVLAQLGDPVAGPLLTVTSTAKMVSLPIDPADGAAVHVGMPVTIVRPDNRTAPGTVTAISADVQSGGGTSTGSGAAPTLDIAVTPDNQHDFADLDVAPVQVRITTESHPGVLAVPVEALLALRGGGYALQLPDGRLVPVTTGFVAQDMVQISGPGIVAGLTVVTTSS